MSWNDITDLELDIKNEGHCYFLIWECPRCNHKNETQLEVTSLIFTQEISCANTEICGEKQAYFGLSLSIDHGGYKGLSDRARTKSQNRPAILNHTCSCDSPTSSVCMVHGCVG